MKGGLDMSPRTGRPPIQSEPRKETLNLRLTKQEKNDIEYCAKRLNISRTDTIMKGIRLVKKEIEQN